MSNFGRIVSHVLRDFRAPLSRFGGYNAERNGFKPCANYIIKRNKSSSDGFEDLDKPIKFSTSKAADWSAQQTFSGTLRPDTPWIQPYAVIFSTAAILLYFCVLREENDLDEEMGTTIWARIPGLESQQLQVVYDYNKERNIDNTAVVARMKELKELESGVNPTK